jgi:hypothetical protein
MFAIKGIRRYALAEDSAQASGLTYLWHVEVIHEDHSLQGAQSVPGAVSELVSNQHADQPNGLQDCMQD